MRFIAATFNYAHCDNCSSQWGIYGYAVDKFLLTVLCLTCHIAEQEKQKVRHPVEVF